MKINVANGIECNYDADKEIGSIIIYDTTASNLDQKLIEWRLRKQDIEDAVKCKWLLFDQHDEVWMPTLEPNNQVGKPLIITMESSEPDIEVIFEKTPAFRWTVHDMGVLQKIHEFWKSIVAP